MPAGYLDHAILKTVLNQDFLLVGEGWAVFGHSQKAFSCFEYNLEDYWLQIIIGFLESEFDCAIDVNACAGVAQQVNHIANFELVNCLLRQPDTSIHSRHLILLAHFTVGVCEVNYEAEGSCVSTVVFDFWAILLSNCFVDVFVNEGLHRVQVEDVFHDGVL